MKVDLSVLDEPSTQVDLSVLDEPKPTVDLSVLDEPRTEVDLSVLEDDPSVGQIVGGLATEVALGEGLKFAGATSGAALGSVVPGLGTLAGAGLGYLVGGISGGVSGSIAAQKLEGRGDDISWGRVLSDTLLNVIPFGAGKVTKGAKLLPRLVDNSIKQGGLGAGISVTGAQIEKGVDEGQLLTPEEFFAAAGVGAGLGVGLGATGALLNKSYNKLLNKSSKEIDDLYNKGDVDAVTVIDAITGGNPNGRVNRMLGGIQQYVIPSRVIGRRATEDLNMAKNQAEAAKNSASKAFKIINNVYDGLGTEDKRLVDAYIEGRATTLPGSALPMRETIEEARDLITESQNKIIELADKGYLDLDDVFVAKIRQSMRDGNYLTQEYRFYEDPNFTPSPDIEFKLRQKLFNEGATEEEVTGLLQKLYDSRNKNDIRMGLNTIAENTRLFKKKDELIGELQEFLGVYRNPGEKFFGTISRLGQFAAEQNAGFKIVDNFRKTGAALKASEVPGEMSGQYQKLIIRNKPISLDGEQLYVLPEINESINQIYGVRLPKDVDTIAENAFTRIMSTTTGLSKFVKVPLAPAAYSPQIFANVFSILGQGMNPIRGFGKGAKVGLAEFKGKGLTLKEFNRYRKLGLLDKDSTVGDIRAAFEKGVNAKIIPEGLKTTTKKIGKLYSLIDTANRISVFENYQVQLRKMSPDIEKKMTREQIDELAAELTNATYQNYDRINPSLRYLSRVGVLNEFVAFLLEMNRTTFNQARLAKQMIDGTFAKRMKDEFDITIDQSAAMRNGAIRMASLGALIGSASAGIYAWNKSKGFSDEEMKAIRETVAPDWDDSSALLFERNGDKIGMTNMAYRIPIADMTAIVEAGIGTGDFGTSASEMFQATTDKFFGKGTMNAKNLLSSIMNRDIETGKKISTSQNLGERLFDQTYYYVTDTFKPGFMNDLRKFDERTGKELVARYLLGERKMNSNIMESAGRKINDLQDNIRANAGAYSGALKYEDDALSSYNKYNNNYRSNAEVIVNHVKNLRTLGKNDKEISDLLKSKNISRVLRESAMIGQVPNMPIAVGVSGNKEQRVKRYVEIFEKLPRDMGIQMIQQELATKKINAQTARFIDRVLKLRASQAE